jgi:CBS domain containing-hemolysin-like protein
MFIATALVGNNLANYLTSLAIVMGTQSLITHGAMAAELIVPLLFAPVLFVLGELAPKYLFLHAPNRLLRAGGPLFFVFVPLFLPISGLLWCINWAMAWFVGETPERVRLTLARRELQQALDEGHEVGLLHPAQRELARGISAVAARPILEYAVPPAEVPRARGDMSQEEILDLARRFRIAEVPLEADDGTRELTGYVRLIDLSLSPRSEGYKLCPFLEISATDTHIEALMRMHATNEPMARVVDAEGITVGIVSAARLREPLFGGGK